MKAIEITAPGGPENLQLCERPDPKPGPGEVLIRVAAAGVNRPDVLQRKGFYPPPKGASDLPGLEVSGEIVALGENADAYAIGDQVCALLPGGGYAELATADQGACLPIPLGLSLHEAAGLPEAFFTVWANVFDDAGLQAGETLLVHGALSGIGVTAITLAKARGARVIATAGSDEKAAKAAALGANKTFNYQTDAWDDAIKEEGGADVVLDMAGGDFFIRNLSTLKPHGRHVSIAFLRGPEATINIFQIMQKQLRLSGSTMKARGPAEKARLAEALKKEVWPLFEKGALKPVIDSTFPLDQASQAHIHMESGEHVGKIILTVD